MVHSIVNAMKTTLGHVRKMIREALMGEEAWVPGRWMPGEGEPVDAEDQEKLGEVDEDAPCREA
jgi:hypothetical protein